MGGIHIWHLLIILVIVLLLFGTKRLKSLGSDLGGAIKGFKDSMGHGNDSDKSNDATGDGDKIPTGGDSVQRTEKKNVKSS
ncbi:MAG: Sec-independent protein translocase subunit TatA [Lysobacterales bacterium]